MNPRAPGQAFRQMDPVGLERDGQADIGADKKHQAATARQVRESPALEDRVGGAKGAKHHARSARQACDHVLRPWSPNWVGEEQQMRQALPRPARLA